MTSMIVEARQVRSRATPATIRAVTRAGIVYENKLAEALRLARMSVVLVERNPWFHYRKDDGTSGYCCPDLLVWYPESKYIVVIEAKLTWVPGALPKLRELYCPVIRKALSLPTKPLVICKNLIPESPFPASSIGLALESRDPLYVWRGKGSVIL